jgi:hypothetical protein
MLKRTLTSLAVATALTLLTIGAALALDQTNGSGLTHNGASLGFNAKLDLRGQITYVAHDGTGFWVQCDELSTYRNLRDTPKGYPRTKVTAPCTDKDGATIYVEIYFVDRGEPGSRDIERIFFTYDSDWALDANGDPNVWDTQCNSGAEISLGCMDSGIITTGNVQIHQSADPALAETVVIGTDATA